MNYGDDVVRMEFTKKKDEIVNYIIFDNKRICSAKAPSGLDCDLFILNKKHYQTIIHRDFPEIDK
jgi:hypothetical protein